MVSRRGRRKAIVDWGGEIMSAEGKKADAARLLINYPVAKAPNDVSHYKLAVSVTRSMQSHPI